MKASYVMVSKVITVGPNTTVQEIANILLSNRISAVPVVDAHGALIGIVSEGDLIHRVEARIASFGGILYGERRSPDGHPGPTSRPVAPPGPDRHFEGRI